MTSRPLVSAPRKYLELQVGPMGTPSTSTMLRCLPSTRMVSARRLREGVVSAIWSAHSGAAIAHRTRTMNRAPKASATLLRRSRRIASCHGPSPPVGTALCSSPARTAGTSVETSVVAGSVVDTDARPGPGGRRSGPPSGSATYFRHRAVKSRLYTGCHVVQSSKFIRSE